MAVKGGKKASKSKDLLPPAEAAAGAGEKSEKPWPATMGKAEYGRYRRAAFGKGSPAMVTKMIQTGRLSTPALREDGRIDRAAADAQLAAGRDPQADLAGGSSGDAGGSAYREEKMRLAKAQRETKELELAKLRGEVIKLEDAQALYFETFRSLRDQLQTMAADLAPQLRGLIEPREIQAVLAKGIETVLTNAAQDLEERAREDEQAGDSSSRSAA